MNKSANKSACFTGHRTFDCSMQNVEHGIKQLVEIAIDKNVNHFYCGMAIGTDLLAAKVLTEMGLPWTAVIPCLNQSEKWSREWQKIYFSLLSQATSDIVMQPEYSPSCMNARNAWMVKHSSLLLAVWNRTKRKGGTYNTIEMAKKKGIEIVNFNPNASSTDYSLTVHTPKPKSGKQLKLNLGLELTITSQ